MKYLITILLRKHVAKKQNNLGYFWQRFLNQIEKSCSQLIVRITKSIRAHPTHHLQLCNTSPVLHQTEQQDTIEKQLTYLITILLRKHVAKKQKICALFGNDF